MSIGLLLLSERGFRQARRRWGGATTEERISTKTLAKLVVVFMIVTSVVMSLLRVGAGWSLGVDAVVYVVMLSFCGLLSYREFTRMNTVTGKTLVAVETVLAAAVIVCLVIRVDLALMIK